MPFHQCIAHSTTDMPVEDMQKNLLATFKKTLNREDIKVVVDQLPGRTVCKTDLKTAHFHYAITVAQTDEEVPLPTAGKIGLVDVAEPTPEDLNPDAKPLPDAS